MLFFLFKKPVRCKLFHIFRPEEPRQLLGYGRLLSSTPGQVVHGIPLADDERYVILEKVHDNSRHAFVPLPPPSEEETYCAELVGCPLRWPANLLEVVQPLDLERVI